MGRTSVKAPRGVTEQAVDDMVDRRLNTDPCFVSAFVEAIQAQTDRDLAYERIEASSLKRKVHRVIPDLRIFLHRADGRITRILVENKIRHTLGDQPSRYLESCRFLDGTWLTAFPILICPVGYVEEVEAAAAFTARVTYEQMADWVRGADHTLLRRAIEAYRKPYTPNPDERVTLFHAQYRRWARDNVPDLHINPESQPKGLKGDGAHTMYLQVRAMLRTYDGFPTVTFHHQWMDEANGPAVKIMLRGLGFMAQRLDDQNRARRLAESGVFLVRAGDSLAVAMRTDALDPQEPFVDQQEQAEAGMRRALELAGWWNRSEDIMVKWGVAQFGPAF